MRDVIYLVTDGSTNGKEGIIGDKWRGVAISVSYACGHDETRDFGDVQTPLLVGCVI